MTIMSSSYNTTWSNTATFSTWYSVPPAQQYCGQVQPHGPHTWVNGSNMYANCAGLVANRTSFRQDVRMPDELTDELLADLSKRALLLLNTRLLLDLRNNMSDLDQAVDDLKAAVDGVAQRLLPKIQELEAALAEGDSDAADAVAAIRAEVDALNALGTDPTTPVDTEATPVDPPEIEVPADPDAGGTTDESTDASSPDTSDEAAPAEGDAPADSGDTADTSTDTSSEPPRDPETGQFVSSDG